MLNKRRPVQLETMTTRCDTGTAGSFSFQLFAEKSHEKHCFICLLFYS